MIKNFKTVDQAKKEIEGLLRYVYLAETFVPISLEDHILREYAYLGSIPKVVEKMNDEGFSKEGKPIESEDVRTVLNRRGEHELHKTIRTVYMKRTRPARRR